MEIELKEILLDLRYEYREKSDDWKKEVLGVEFMVNRVNECIVSMFAAYDNLADSHYQIIRGKNFYDLRNKIMIGELNSMRIFGIKVGG